MKLFLSLVFCSLFILGAPQSASAVEGCDPVYWQAQKTAADARRAYDEAGVAENTHQNDSTLALSCFDQASRVSAYEAGQIFSGDFTSEMNDVVNDPVVNLLSGGFLDSVGNSPDFSGVVTTAMTDLLGGFFPGAFPSSSFNCTVIQDLYDDRITAPMSGNALVMSYLEAEAMALSGATATKFQTKLSANGAGGAFQDAQAARAALPPNVYPSFAGADTLLGVFTAAGF